jgi:fatty-acyl-CoA synthase
MLAYWGDKEATARAVDEDGWMHTGDLSTMDDEGYVKIVGRIKDMIIRGGENIYPREIEEFLLTIERVTDAYVIGVPSERYGDEVMGWVKLRDGVSLTADEPRAACRGRIATYKIPRFWKFVDSFPMTVTGKVQKFRMRDLAIEELELQLAAGIARRKRQGNLKNADSLRLPQLRRGTRFASRATCGWRLFDRQSFVASADI